MLGEILDFIAGIFIQYGNYLKIRKKSLGWLFSLVAIIYWICRAQSMSLNSQAFWHICSFMMAAYGYWNWRKNGT